MTRCTVDRNSDGSLRLARFLSGCFRSVIMRRFSRRYSMKKMAVVIVFLAACAFATGQSDSTDPRSVVEDYVSAWNHHDFGALDRLIASDGIHDDIPNSVRAQGPDQVK